MALTEDQVAVLDLLHQRERPTLWEQVLIACDDQRRACESLLQEVDSSLLSTLSYKAEVRSYREVQRLPVVLGLRAKIAALVSEDLVSEPVQVDAPRFDPD